MIKSSKFRTALYLLLSYATLITLGCSKEPLVVLSERDAELCASGIDFYSRVSDERYKSDCMGKAASLIAYVVDRPDGDGVVVNLKSPFNRVFYRENEDFFVVKRSLPFLSEGDKLEIEGEFDKRHWWYSYATLRRASVVELDLTEEEQEERSAPPPVSPEILAARNRAAAAEAQAEADLVLLEYANEKRADLKSRAIRVETINSGSMLQEGYVMENGEVITCIMTWPGPVYDCN